MATKYDIDAPDPGRPREIEELANLYLIHPLSRRLVRLLLPSAVTPNAVSVFGAIVAAAAAACFYCLPWPWAALAGFACMCAAHIIDGADGRLARVSGRTSNKGEIIDGLCDYAGSVIIYLSLAMVLARDLGATAWLLALAAGFSNVFHAGGYEFQRRTYNHRVYGRSWLRYNVRSSSGFSANNLSQKIFASIARFFLFIQKFVSADSPALDLAMSRLTSRDGETTDQVRELYRRDAARRVRFWSILGQNHKTLAMFLGMLAGSPLYFFIYVATVLNMALVVLIVRQHRVNSALLAKLAPYERGTPAL